jgi:hypothetical protein
METSLTADGRGVRHGLYAQSEKALKACNQGVRRIMNHMLAIAPWLSESDRAALRAWCELEWLTRRVMLVLTQPDLDRDAMLKWSAEYRAIRATQNTIGNGLGLNAASRKQLASAAKQVDIVAELAALNAKASEPAADAENTLDRTSVAS